MAAPPRDSGFDPVRAGGAVLAVLLLLAVVALAASAGGPATGGAGRDYVDPLATLLFVLGGVWVAALLVASPLMTGLTLTGGEPKPRRWHGNVLAGVIFFTLILAGLAVLRKLRPGGGNGDGYASGDRSDGDDARRRPAVFRPSIPPRSTGSSSGSSSALPSSASAILAAVLVRPKGRSMPELEARKELERMLDETLDDLHRERDPRRAVIAAYARMERSLGSYGLPRRAGGGAARVPRPRARGADRQRGGRPAPHAASSSARSSASTRSTRG